MRSAIITATLSLLFSAGLCAQQTTSVHFDGAEAPVSLDAFAYQGSSWRGGRVRTEGAPGLYASGAFFYAPGPEGAEVVFERPVQSLRFHFAHGFGQQPGTATAYGADGAALATVASRQAGVKGAEENFTLVAAAEPVARVVFNGGAVDAVSWQSPTDGTVVVDTGLNGAWVNTTHVPLLDGQGMLMEYLPDSGTLFLAWFTFEDGQAPAPQRWLVAQGPVAGAEATLQVYAVSGGVFNRPPDAAQAAIGTMTLRFDTCNRAEVEFAIPAEELGGSFEITRLRSLVSDAYSCGGVASAR